MVFISIYDIHEHEYEDKGLCVPPFQLKAVFANSLLNHLTSLHVASKPSFLRLTGIICEIGTKASDLSILEKLVESGMNIACLDFTHGSEKCFTEISQNLRTIANNHNESMGVNGSLAIALSTESPSIRIQNPNKTSLYEITLYKDTLIQLTGNIEYEYETNQESCFYVNYANFHKLFEVDTKIIIGNSSVLLICIGIEEDMVLCRVVRGGSIKGGERIHLPGVSIELPILTKKNIAAIKFAIENDIDMIFASNIRQVSDIVEIRKFLEENGSNLPIISQIENQQGLTNIDGIIETSDGVIIDRVTLALEMEEEKLISVQKFVINKCSIAGKPVILKTPLFSFLDILSKIVKAELSDIANAVLDGIDCIFLCHERSAYEHADKCIQQIATTCKEAEAAVWQKQIFKELSNNIKPPVIVNHAVASAAVQISLQLPASAIIMTSTSLKSAQDVVQYKPKCPVLAVTRNTKKAAQVQLYRGVIPLVYAEKQKKQWLLDIKRRVYYGINFGRKKGFIQPGDPVVILTGSHQGSGCPDVMRISYIPKDLPHGSKCTC